MPISCPPQTSRCCLSWKNHQLFYSIYCPRPLKLLHYLLQTPHWESPSAQGRLWSDIIPVGERRGGDQYKCLLMQWFNNGSRCLTLGLECFLFHWIRHLIPLQGVSQSRFQITLIPEGSPDNNVFPFSIFLLLLLFFFFVINVISSQGSFLGASALQIEGCMDTTAETRLLICFPIL